MTLRPRVIPSLTLLDGGLVKTTLFRKPRYIGDPINTLRIFNEKMVDEIVIVDIGASKKKQNPNILLIREMVSECFIPITYGGGIQTEEEVHALISAGVEKVSLNSVLFSNPAIVSKIADKFGRQSLIASVDVKKNFLGRRRVFDSCSGTLTQNEPIEFIRKMVNLGVGEVLLNDVDRDGTMEGYDVELMNSAANAVPVPLIACGGAGEFEHIEQILKGKVAAAAAGSFFVYQGKSRGVLISYPSEEQLAALKK